LDAPPIARINWISAADFRAFYAISPPEAAFRQIVLESATRSVCRNTDEFRVPVTAALIGRLLAFPQKE
jgi:hypothetical protein